jgi:hypothetical protein
VEPSSPVGTFITPQSLVSFPGATAAISLIWGVINRVAAPAPTARNLIGLAICFVVGMVIYWINITDPAVPATPREKQIGFVIALLNICMLFSASFGAQELATAAGVPTQPR